MQYDFVRQGKQCNTTLLKASKWQFFVYITGNGEASRRSIVVILSVILNCHVSHANVMEVLSFRLWLKTNDSRLRICLACQTNAIKVFLLEQLVACMPKLKSALGT